MTHRKVAHIDQHREQSGDQEQDLPSVDRFMTESSPLAAYIIQNGLFSRVSPRFAQVFGNRTPEKFNGLSFWDFVHPDDRKIVRSEVNIGRLDDTISHPPLFRLVSKKNGIAWTHLSRDRVLECGAPALWGYLLDDETIRLMTAELSDSLTRYETILDDVDIQLAEINLEGKITFINDAGCRIWKVPRSSLIGLHSSTYLLPDSREKVIDIYKSVFNTGVPVKNAVVEVKSKSGRSRTIETSVSLTRNAAGEITGFRNVAKDITERIEAGKKLSEQQSRLQAIFRSVKDAIITVNPALTIEEANRSTETICEMAVRDMLGKSLADCPAKCSLACNDVLSKTIQTRKPVNDYRIECDHQERMQQVVNICSAPLFDPTGDFMGAVMVIRDITRQRDMERELRVRNQFQNIIGRNKAMQDIYQLLEDLANIDTTVLVTGESGTGKELVARALHYSGNRAFKPFISVNCSALTENLLESELFGHVKGAFTGAIRDKQGRFQAAHGGTILLDEIGDVSPIIQVKLLRALQEKAFERVGDTKLQKVDVRVIACTNRDLKELVNIGQFRQDLYYRLKVVEIAIPPLRKRLEDLPLLVDHFRNIFNKRFKKSVEGISTDVLNTFMAYHWPGNVRELEHVMEHAFVLCHGETITMKHLPGDILNYNGPVSSFMHPVNKGKRTIDKKDIISALHRTKGNKSEAARMLGISRRTIYRKIEVYNITGFSAPAIPI